MAVMETIKPEVKRRVISDFYHKNLIKRKALYLKAFLFKIGYWGTILHQVMARVGAGDSTVHR